MILANKDEIDNAPYIQFHTRELERDVILHLEFILQSYIDMFDTSIEVEK